jgi:hypothetical protein
MMFFCEYIGAPPTVTVEAETLDTPEKVAKARERAAAAANTRELRWVMGTFLVPGRLRPRPAHTPIPGQWIAVNGG